MSESEDIKKKRGRPPKEGAKKHRLDVRLTDEEKEMLIFICTKEGISISEAASRMIKSQYELTKFRY